MKLLCAAAAVAVACGLAACGGQQAGDDAAAVAPPPAERVVNVYNWSDYMALELLEQFEAETGIKVNYDTFDSLELLETRLLTGNTYWVGCMWGTTGIASRVRLRLVQARSHEQTRTENRIWTRFRTEQ